jgi:Uma2 family endonuclease
MNRLSTARSLPFTWDEYRTWRSDERWEIVDGEAYAMSPAPTVRHQLIHAALFTALFDQFRHRPCRVISSPLDVKLSATDVVQPDIVVVCDHRQITETHIEGGPSLVVEILSPSTAQRDRGVKMDAYARAGVCEVWLVTPWPQSVEVFVLDGPTYRRHAVFVQTQTLRSAAFPELKIGLAAVFDFPLQPGEEPPVVREPPPHRYGSATP